MSLQMLEVTTLPIYLPNDIAPVPFGNPLPVTVTDASPGVFTAVGYAPVNGDLVAFSAASGVALPTGITVGTIYFVVSASGDTFEISATSGGAPITISGTLSAVLHLINSAQPVVDLPFKPGNTVLAINLTGSDTVLDGAPEVSFAYPLNGGGSVTAYTSLGTVKANSMLLVQLNADWIKCASNGPIYLLQV